MSPTQRTLKALRDEGWIAGIVEKWNAYAKIRQDLFGIIDIVAIGGGYILGVQATSGSNVSARINKCRENGALQSWKDSGGVFQVWGWSKRGARGKRKTWQPRIEQL